jgi:hypothetical protein
MDAEMTKEEALREARKLIEEHRADSLWFLRDDVCPTEPDALERLLKLIEAHSDVATFVQARRLREWFSRNSSGASAGS